MKLMYLLFLSSMLTVVQKILACQEPEVVSICGSDFDPRENDFANTTIDYEQIGDFALVSPKLPSGFKSFECIVTVLNGEEAENVFLETRFDSSCSSNRVQLTVSARVNLALLEGESFDIFTPIESKTWNCGQEYVRLSIPREVTFRFAVNEKAGLKQRFVVNILE